ncbi:Nucleolar protein 12 [Microbotryomycetes sp. JL221]|nr:Nucleolar protein 12 [Microbotryomycetes sp. JL221]
MAKKQKTKHDDPSQVSSSLSSFLLGAATTEPVQDDIFTNSKGPSKAFDAVKPTNTTKQTRRVRVTQPDSDNVDDNNDDDDDSSSDITDAIQKILDEPSDNEDELEQAYAAKLAAKRLQQAKSKRKRQPQHSDDDDDQSSHDENNQHQQDESDQADSNNESEPDVNEEDQDDEILDIDRLMQASLEVKQQLETTTRQPKTQTKNQQKAESKKRKAEERKKAHAQETSEERDARTLFIGNVPVDCSTKHPLKKRLIRHLLSSDHVIAKLPKGCPPLKCDAIRFRSIAFASKVFGRKPVTIDPETGEQIDNDNHARKRTKAWRSNANGDNDDDDDAEHGHGGRQLRKGNTLTDAQKRKVAFVKGELNEGKQTCNAYLVLEKLPESYKQVTIDEIMDILVQTTSGTVFEDHTLRGDRVRPKSSAAKFAAAQTTAKPDATIQIENTGPLYSVPAVEARRTIFIGGLDFAESEENVRKAVETVLIRERGTPEDGAWVNNVRIIRDASSGLGKGFGYVLMKDDTCVDELLALPDGKKLKVSKRKVRLERCKTQVAAARAKAAAQTRQTKGLPRDKNKSSSNFGARDSRKPAAPPAVLSTSSSSGRANKSHRDSTVHNIGNESAQKKAEQLASLPKEERKAVKASDAERLQRRAQKKQAKVLKERYERKMANAEKKGGTNAILGRHTRREKRDKQEKKRVAAGNKTGKRAKF